jgi:hypothetical protein
VQALSQRVEFNASPILQILDIREKKLERTGIDVSGIVARYLAAVEWVIAAVDMALDTTQGSAWSSGSREGFMGKVLIVLVVVIAIIGWSEWQCLGCT